MGELKYKQKSLTASSDKASAIVYKDTTVELTLDEALEKIATLEAENAELNRNLEWKVQSDFLPITTTKWREMVIQCFPDGVGRILTIHITPGMVGTSGTTYAFYSGSYHSSDNYCGCCVGVAYDGNTISFTNYGMRVNGVETTQSITVFWR